VTESSPGAIDRQKLVNLLRTLSILNDTPIKEDTEAKHSSPEEPVSSPLPRLNSYSMNETPRHHLWGRFKTKVLHL